MAFPTLYFNSAGSDTLASGDNTISAITGSGASLNTSTTVDLSADTPNLSSVPTDGSACLWVQTSSGRQFSQITGVDDSADTISVATTYDVTESSRNWAIGGKRASVDDTNSRILFTNDAEAGWTIELETDQTITSVITIPSTVRGDEGGNGLITLQGSKTDKDDLVIWLQSGGNFAVLDFDAGELWNVKNLKFTSDNGGTACSVRVDTNTEWNAFSNCVFGDATNRLTNGLSRGGGSPIVFCYDCIFEECNNYGAQDQGGTYSNCIFRNNNQNDVSYVAGTRARGNTVYISCLIYGNNRHGIAMTDQGTMTVINCIIDNNTSNGIETQPSNGTNLIQNCSITNNGGYGIGSSNGTAHPDQFFIVNCNFGTGATSNTSGDVETAYIEKQSGCINADPEFVDANGGNFTSTSVAMRTAGVPSIIGNSRAYTSIGLQQKPVLEGMYNPFG